MYWTCFYVVCEDISHFQKATKVINVFRELGNEILIHIEECATLFILQGIFLGASALIFL